MPTKLESDFAQELWDAFHEAKNKYRFKSTRFIQMMSDYGAVDTARRLLETGPSKIQSGLTELWRYNRLDLSIEAKVIIPRYRLLFTDELREVARQRLENHQFDFKTSTGIKRGQSKGLGTIKTLCRGRFVTKPRTRF